MAAFWVFDINDSTVMGKHYFVCALQYGSMGILSIQIRRVVRGMDD